MTRTIRLKAPAKVNFRLDVLRRRPDGYHDLRMVMQRIDLCDELEISVHDTPGIRVHCSGADLPTDEGNIVWRAADAILKRSGSRAGVSIRINKHIPVAAGLGGGSSDAATTLMGLNSLLDLKLADDELMQLGLALGADVPFFIFKKPAIAEGVGEKLTPLEGMPIVWLLLVNPGIHVPTSWAYKNLGLTTEKVAAKIPFLYETSADICQIMSNDLETVTLKHHPLIGEIKAQLTAAGAEGVLMSGSGSTVFAVFADQSAAVRAKANFVSAAAWFTAVVSTLH